MPTPINIHEELTARGWTEAPELSAFGFTSYRKTIGEYEVIVDVNEETKEVACWMEGDPLTKGGFAGQLNGWYVESVDAGFQMASDFFGTTIS